MSLTKEQVVEGLHIALQLEQGLCCAYLYTSFTIRKAETDRLPPEVLRSNQNMEAFLLRIARQEIDHTGHFLNILNAMGERPHLWRPNLPIPPLYYPIGVSMQLLRYEGETIDQYICFEKPTEFEYPGCPYPAEAGVLQSVTLPPWRSIQELYDALIQAFRQPDAPGWFVPPSENLQITGSMLGLTLMNYGVRIASVTNPASAIEAMEFIICEGEGSNQTCIDEKKAARAAAVGGAPEDHVISHFEMYLRMREEISKLNEKYPDVSLSRNVGPNPWLPSQGVPPDYPGIQYTQVNAQNAIILMDLFNEGYEELLYLLLLLYNAKMPLNMTEEQTQKLTQMQEPLVYLCFFPMMTMFIRPLGTLLTWLPASQEPRGPLAGPNFQVSDRFPEFVKLPLDEQIRLAILLLFSLAVRAEDAYNRTEDLPDDMRQILYDFATTNTHPRALQGTRRTDRNDRAVGIRSAYARTTARRRAAQFDRRSTSAGRAYPAKNARQPAIHHAVPERVV